MALPLIAGALTVASMGLSIYKGIASKNAYDAQADTTRSYGEILLGDALKEAVRIEDAGARFAQGQKMMYIGSGVEYGGSAVITVKQTQSWAAAEARATRARGTAEYQYMRKTASVQEGMGRAALIGGIAEAVGSAGNFLSSAKFGGGGGGSKSSGGGGSSLVQVSKGWGNNFSGIPGFNMK